MLVLYKQVSQGETKFRLESDNKWKYALSNYIRLQDVTYKLVKIAEMEENEIPGIVDVLTRKMPKGRVENQLMEF